MDNDKDVVSDSDSFVMLSDDNSAGSDTDNSVGSDSEKYVIVGRENYGASDSGEDLFDESNEQSKNVDNDSFVGTDSEDDVSNQSEKQVESADSESRVSTDSEEDLSDEIKQKLKNVVYDSSVCTDSEDDVSAEIKQKLKNMDINCYFSADSDEDLSDGSGEQLKCVDNDSYVDNDCTDLFDGSGEPVKIVEKKYCVGKSPKYPCKRIGVVIDSFEFPEYTKNLKKMEINDVTMEHVLPFLPAKVLCRLRTVSKEWDQWIGSAFFIHKQTCYFKDISGLFCQVPGGYPFFISLDNDAYGIPRSALSFLPEIVSVKTSCNGLLCCQSCDGEDTYYICNPVNQQWKKLPKSKYYHGPECYPALAFEPSVMNFAEHFQLVCAFTVTGHSGVYFDIYSSGSSTWGLSESVCYELEAVDLTDNVLFLKGVIFWETKTGAILAFNLKEKQYGMLPLPCSTGPLGGIMTEKNGELCYILPHEEDGQYTLETYGDIDMSLKQTVYLVGEMFNNVTGELKVLASVRDDMVLLLVGSMVIVYHVKAGEVKLLRSEDQWTKFGNAKFHPYVSSLVEIESASHLNDASKTMTKETVV